MADAESVAPKSAVYHVVANIYEGKGEKSDRDNRWCGPIQVLFHFGGQRQFNSQMIWNAPRGHMHTAPWFLGLLLSSEEDICL